MNGLIRETSYISDIKDNADGYEEEDVDRLCEEYGFSDRWDALSAYEIGFEDND